MRRIGESECNQPDEVCKWLNKIFENINQMEAKIVQNAQEIEALKKKGKKKMKSKGSASMRVIAILMLIVAIAGLCYAAYVPTDINYDIASNPESLSIYLRDCFANISSNSYLFTPTATAPTASQGLVYFNSNTNLLQVSLDGTSFVPIDTAGGVTLDGAYDSGSAGGGRTVNVTDGAVQLTNTENDTASILGVTYSGNTTGDGVTITMSVGSGDAIEIENTGTGSDIELTSGSTFGKAGDIVMKGTTPTLTIGDAGAEDAQINWDGAAQDFSLGLEDATDDLVLSMDTTLGTTNIIAITDTPTTITFHDATEADATLNFDGHAVDFHISLDDSDDSLEIGFGTTVETDERITINGSTTETIIEIGDAASEDMRIEFDGAAQNYYFALDDGTDDFLIGLGSTVDTTEYLRFYYDSFVIGVGDASGADAGFLLDGNEGDFYIVIDDSSNDFVIGSGATVGADERISVLEGAAVQHIKLGEDTTAEDIILSWDGNALDFSIRLDDTTDELEIGYGTVAETDERITIGGGVTETVITLGDATTAEDISLNFDGNAKDFRISLDDTADDLEIGLGTTIETTERLTISGHATNTLITIGDAAQADQYIVLDGNEDDWYMALDDTTNHFSIGLGATLATDTRINIVDDATNTVVQFGDDAANADIELNILGEDDDYWIAYDDTTQDLTFGLGTTVATDNRLAIQDDADNTHIIIGDGAQFDQMISFDGSATDYYIALDDTDDELKIGVGTTVDTTPAITIYEDTQVVEFEQTALFTGGQTRTVIPTVVLDGTVPPSQTAIGTSGQSQIPVYSFDANPNATGDDYVFLHWRVPAGYVVDSADLFFTFSYSTAETDGDDVNFDCTVLAITPGSGAAGGTAFDAAGSAVAALDVDLVNGDGDEGKVMEGTFDIEVTAIAAGDEVVIAFWVVEASCDLAASGTVDIHNWTITYESTE